jgi:hypothetical protein
MTIDLNRYYNVPQPERYAKYVLNSSSKLIKNMA